jgi:uncharacterized membrane protein YhaH (DUF805 family)
MSTTSTSAPLSLPLYGASFGQAVSRYFKKYATFSGRASRSEFWWVFLFNAIIGIVIWILMLTLGLAGARVDEATGMAVPGPGYFVIVAIAGLWGLATIVPHLAVSWRRLHDTDKSGGFYFLGLIPFVGSIIVIVLLALESNPNGARFDQR